MDAALALAQSGLGKTAPNPSVGCVLVKGGIVVGSGQTADGGRPHAETEALKSAGENARGATAYVTLEPCSHTGETPPCAQGLIDAGIVRVVVACLDRDPRVAGGGITLLENAGIDVFVGVRSDEGVRVNQGFFSLLEKNRPFIAIDDHNTGYDATLDSEAPVDMDAFVSSLAHEGLTRVRAVPATPMAIALSQTNFVDQDASESKTPR